MLERIARGKTNAEIADELGISLDGAKYHVREILAKLNVNSREDAASEWRRMRSPLGRLRHVVLVGMGSLPKSGPVLAAVGAAVVVAGVFGLLVLLAGGGEEDEPPASAALTTPSPASTPAASVTAEPATQNQAQAYCFIDLPDTWAAAFAQHEIPRREDQRIVPVAAAADASRIFGSLYSPEWSGLVSISAPGEILRIQEFADPASDQISGASFDGRWLIWTEFRAGADSQLRAWDSDTGETWDIARAADRPVASEGKAAWLQSTGSGGWALHLYSFAARTDEVVDEKAGWPVLFWDSNLFWAVKETPGERRGHFEMMDLRTGTRSAPPAPLASLTRLGSTAAQGGLVAWTEDGHSILIWREGDHKPTKIVPPGLAPIVDWIAIAGDLVTWSGSDREWAADTRSHSVAPITTQYGYRFTNGDALVVVEPLGPLKVEGQRGPMLKVTMLDATTLPPLPRCP